MCSIVASIRVQYYSTSFFRMTIFLLVHVQTFLSYVCTRIYVRTNTPQVGFHCFPPIRLTSPSDFYPIIPWVIDVRWWLFRRCYTYSIIGSLFPHSGFDRKWRETGNGSRECACVGVKSGEITWREREWNEIGTKDGGEFGGSLSALSLRHEYIQISMWNRVPGSVSMDSIDWTESF